MSNILHHHFHHRIYGFIQATRQGKSWLSILYAATVLAFSLGAGQTGKAQVLRSPHGKVIVHFAIDSQGAPTYEVNFDGKQALLRSVLGFAPSYRDGFQIEKVVRRQYQGTWKPLYAERDIIPNRYRELDVNLKRKSGRGMRIELRAFDEGLAIRYVLPSTAEAPIKLPQELTEFHVPAETYAYEEHNTEGEYHRVPAAAIQPKCERPLTLEYRNGLFASIAEAGTVAFPHMLLRVVQGKQDVLAVDLDGEATLDARSATPWRLVLFGEKPGDLLEHNYLVLNLNKPSALKNTSWIKPGKLMREMTLTTEGAMQTIDFAAAHHLQYVLFDSGWYGAQDQETRDATRARAGLDLPGVIKYASQHGIGILLYVDRRQMRKQRDILIPLYEKWGVKEVKIGFVDVDSQLDIAWLSETVRKAAEHYLLLDIHDQFRPTGYTRTYPNLLTVEGIRGNEHFTTAQHDATIPFTRYIAGSADYTICYFDKRLKNTHAHQLAMSVESYSPLQSVFWYDRPAAYQGEPEIDWFEALPTVWDDTKVLDGKIGEFAIIARRSGKDWFVGVVNGDEQRKIDLPLRFLAPSRRFTAEIYSDDSAVDTHTHVAIRKEEVNSKTVMPITLLPSGGLALRISPTQ